MPTKQAYAGASIASQHASTGESPNRPDPTLGPYYGRARRVRGSLPHTRSDWRRLRYLEALAGFHVADPALQFRVLGHRRPAVRHVAEIIEQRDYHQIGEADEVSREKPMIRHQPVDLRQAQAGARQGSSDRRLIGGAAEKT